MITELFCELRFLPTPVIMFDEDLFNVFNETASSAEKPGSHTESGSSRKDDTKAKFHGEKGNAEKTPDNKR